MTLSPRRWILPRSALEASYREMALDGALDREGIAMWAGHDLDDTSREVTVTHLVLLRGPGIKRARGYIVISPELLNEVTDALAALGNDTYLVGQVHGHPPFSSTQLSPTDIEGGIRTPEYLSVVAPNYGMASQADLLECGVHVFEPFTGWQTLRLREVMARIVVIDTLDSTPVLIIGATNVLDNRDVSGVTDGVGKNKGVF